MKKFRKDLKGGVSDTVSSVDENITKKDVKPQGKGKKRRRLIIKSMFVMSIIFGMISVSYSWFVQSNTARVEDVSMSLISAQNVTLDSINVYGKLEPVSGDGKNFFVPGIGLTTLETEASETTDLKYVTSAYDKINDTYKRTEDKVTEQTLSNALVPNVRVIDFSVKMSGEKTQLLLMPGSAITPTSGAPAYLPGAIRVSFFKKNESNVYDQLFIWIPDVMSTVDADTPVLEDEYVIVTGTSTDGTVQTLEITGETGTATVSGITYIWGELEEAVTLGDVGEYRCVIWLDGNDRECNSALINKKFEIALNIEFAEQKN